MPIGLGVGVPGVRPKLSVQVAFSTDPNSPGAISPTWTPLTNRVLNIQFSRAGRSDEMSLYQSGTATLLLRNSDGAFNPVNTSGPYYGQLLPYRPIRIVATIGGIDYTLWQGYVQRWPQGWTDPTLGFSQIQCVDALAILNQITLDSVYTAEVLSDNPLMFYPLSETTGNTAGNQSANLFSPAQIVHTKAVNATTPGTYSFGTQIAIPGSAGTGIGFTGTNNNGGAGVEDGFVLTFPRFSVSWTGFSFELWCQIPKTPAQFGVIFQACDALHFSPLGGPTTNNAPGTISLYQNGTTSALRLVTPDGGNYLDTAINVNLADGLPHHVVITHTCPSTGGAFVTAVANIYVDGTLVLSASYSSDSSATYTAFGQLGGVAVNAQTLPGSPTFDGRPLIGTVSNFAFYPTVLALPAAQGHYEAGQGFVGEVSGDRATRVLAYGAWQPGLQQVQQGRSTMGPAAIGGQTLLGAVQDVADTELGTLTVTGDGLIDFRSRDDRLLKTTNSVVFGDNTAAGEIPFSLPDQVFDYDPTLVANDIQVTRASGLVAEAFDATSIVELFPASKPLTMNLDTDQQAQDAANFVLGREKDPHLRVETLTVNMGGVNGLINTTIWPALLAMDLHDRVGVRVRPKGAQATSMDGFVEQISMTIDGTGQWDIAIQISPVLGTYGIWDNAGSLWDTAVWAF